MKEEGTIINVLHKFLTKKNIDELALRKFDETVACATFAITSRNIW